MTRARRYDPVPLKDTLGAVADDLRTASPDALVSLSRKWVDVVGHELAAHARPGGLVDGTLTVLVDDATVASVFRQRSGTLARRWSELVGAGVVRELRVVVERPRRDARENARE
jgi:predicted nucleic acid-binding Zn ribbon protein